MKRILLPLILILLTSFALAQQTTFNAFFGKVEGMPNGSIVSAHLEGRIFSTTVNNSQYGYDPAFRVIGAEGSNIEFYLNDVNVANATLQAEGLTALDLSTEPKPQVFEKTRLNETVSAPIATPIRTETQPRREQAPVKATRIGGTGLSSLETALWIALIFFIIGAVIAVIVVLRRQPVAQIIDPAAKQYVYRLYRLGYSIEQITAQMERYGWKASQVKKIFREFVR